jgi:hypothetical protein
MGVCMVISLLIIPHVHRIYAYMYNSGHPWLRQLNPHHHQGRKGDLIWCSPLDCSEYDIPVHTTTIIGVP